MHGGTPWGLPRPIKLEGCHNYGLYSVGAKNKCTLSHMKWIFVPFSRNSVVAINNMWNYMWNAYQLSELALNVKMICHKVAKMIKDLCFNFNTKYWIIIILRIAKTQKSKRRRSFMMNKWHFGTFYRKLKIKSFCKLKLIALLDFVGLWLNGWWEGIIQPIVYYNIIKHNII
jgi:hypothetical protein